jgi:hypothetical protein
VDALELYVIWKGTVKLIISNMVDFKNANLSSVQSDVRVYAILFTFTLR